MATVSRQLESPPEEGAPKTTPGQLLGVDATAAAEKLRRKTELSAWKEAVADFQKPDTRRALWQVATSFGPYFVTMAGVYLSLSVSWWLTAPLAMLAGALLIRVFIIFHDCGHGSFLRSRRANDTWGFLCGILTFTPYFHWRWEHAIHHASSGNLDKRGVGDIWTLTVQEYVDSSRFAQFAYRIGRNPLVEFVIAPVILFLFVQRFPKRVATGRERNSVWWMNLALAGWMAAGISIFGLVPFLIIQTITTAIASGLGVWMFYVQHQYDDVYWARGDDWDYTSAGLHGSSFYKLPRVMQWLTGNIGFHHIHHLSPRVPNYSLERCHNASAIFRDVKPLRLLESFRLGTLALWDESGQKLISFNTFRTLRAQGLTPAPSAS